MRKIKGLDRLEDLIKSYKQINGQSKSPSQVSASTWCTSLVSLLPLLVDRIEYLTGSRLHSLSLSSRPHTQMSRISSWSIIPTCLRTPESYEWSSWVPRMQGSQHSPTSCWAEKYAAFLTTPHTLFISHFLLCLHFPRGTWDLTWDFFVSGRCSLSPRRCTPLAAELWGSSQRKRPRWWVPAKVVQQTGQRVKLRGSPLLLDLKKKCLDLPHCGKGSILFL